MSPPFRSTYSEHPASAWTDGCSRRHVDSAAPARRKAVLPLINRRWARALHGPSHAWRDVSVVESYRGTEAWDEMERAARQRLNTATALAWFRPGRVSCGERWTQDVDWC